MGFNGFSKDFRESLNAMADELKAKKQAQMAPPQEQPMQQDGVTEVMEAMQVFSRNKLSDWLKGLQDSEVKEVARVLNEVNNLSPEEFKQLSGQSTPFDMIGGMFKMDSKDGQACGCGDAQVVTEIDIPLDNTANNSQPEGMGG
jgi:hypothetical protein